CRFERVKLAIGEIERARGAALLIGKIDDDLVAVNRILPGSNLGECVRYDVFSLPEGEFPFAEKNGAVRLRLGEAQHRHLVFNVVLGGLERDGLTRAGDVPSE